jgi:hypothetical protein
MPMSARKMARLRPGLSVEKRMLSTMSSWRRARNKDPGIRHSFVIKATSSSEMNRIWSAIVVSKMVGASKAERPKIIGTFAR